MEMPRKHENAMLQHAKPRLIVNGGRMVNGRLAQNHVEVDFKRDSETLNNKLLTEENNVKENQPTSEFAMSTNVLLIVVGELGALGLSALRPAEEELDTAFEKLNKKQNMGESHVLVVPTEQFLVINRVVQLIANGENSANGEAVPKPAEREFKPERERW